MAQAEKKISRRRFLKASTFVATGAALTYGAVSVPLLRKKNKVLLRPPGALDEDLFLASCIKCGQCLQVCPPQVIHLADIDQGFGIGTPYIIPRRGGCILCSGLPCVLACPTGALNHHLSLGKDAEMGIAVVSSPSTCLAMLGKNDLLFRLEQLQQHPEKGDIVTELRDIVARLAGRISPAEKTKLQERFSMPEISESTLPQLIAKVKLSDLDWLIAFVTGSSLAQSGCRVCLDECPIRDEKTIVFEPKSETQEKGAFFPVVQTSCVGCGVCEEKCPTPVASITISPQKKWPGKNKDHVGEGGQST